MNKRINITLPEETLKLMDRMTEKGERSQFINTAVRYYAKELKKESLNRRLKAGAVARAERDRVLAEEWSVVDYDA